MSNDFSPLHRYTEEVLTRYLGYLDDPQPVNLYSMVIDSIELPLLRSVMKHTGENQSQAAFILGISRHTLRTKLKKHQLLGNPS